MKYFSSTRVWLVIIVVSILMYGFFYKSFACISIPKQENVTGTHGWKVWANESFISFAPKKQAYCVPPGWETIGASVDEDGAAIWPEGVSGVVFRSTDFVSQELPLDERTTIRVLYTAQMPNNEAVEYLKIVSKSFHDMAKLYPDFDSHQLNSHTVLITIGLAGDGSSFETSVYPAPTKDLTIFVRSKNHPRGEELFTHAIAHIYNRHFDKNLAYQEKQDPIPANDWQEMEAAWTEIIFRSDKNALEQRVKELQATHEAIFTGKFSSELAFPFDNIKIFESVTNKAVAQTENATYGEIQYGHYVLAPLVLLSVEGLLEQHQASTTVAKLLSEAQTKNQSFFVLLTAHLPKEEMKHLFNFLTGQEPIPYELLEAGLLRYDTPSAE